MFLLKMSFWNAHHFLHEALPSLCDEAWYHALSFTPTKCIPLQCFWKCLILSHCYSLSQASTILCLKYDSNLRVGASALTFLFPLHQAETKTHDGCVTFSGDLRGFVHPPPTPHDIYHSPNCSPPPDIRYGSVCAFVQPSHVPQNSVL